MGTSTSSKGPGGNSPHIPEWVKTNIQKPNIQPQRFKTFRTNLGKFVTSGDERHLRTAIKSYAGGATGGSGIGPARFGSMASAGSALFDVMTSAGEGYSLAGINLAALNGKDTDIAIDTIVQALTISDGDSDRIRVAMNEALSECLEGYDEFDFSSVTEEMLIHMMLAYVTRCIFGQIVLDSKDAFAKSQNPSQIEQAEKELYSLVESVTDKNMRPLLIDGAKDFSNKKIERIQLDAIKEIWAEWEAYQE